MAERAEDAVPLVGLDTVAHDEHAGDRGSDLSAVGLGEDDLDLCADWLADVVAKPAQAVRTVASRPRIASDAHVIFRALIEYVRSICYSVSRGCSHLPLRGSVFLHGSVQCLEIGEVALRTLISRESRVSPAKAGRGFFFLADQLVLSGPPPNCCGT